GNLNLPLLGTNIMFLRRQQGPESSWTVRLDENDLQWDNEGIWMCIVLENMKRLFVRSHELSRYYMFLKKDYFDGKVRKRLGLNGRTLQELFLLNERTVLSFPNYLSIENHAMEYNGKDSIDPCIDLKCGYGIRFTGDYDKVYRAKEGYNRGLSTTKASA